jgi:hypothetical protein
MSLFNNKSRRLATAASLRHLLFNQLQAAEAA